jgi:8-oxo-dGTP pyrophosphatase MutT (NUDIX family)|tara:strand:- start:2150 stop:2833 length:684 start_codon:yes stop_codon:yes gene_type:complete
MKIFINDIPVYLISPEELKEAAFYGVVLDSKFQKITTRVFIDDVLITHATPVQVEELFQLMTDKALKKVDSITISSKHKKDLTQYIKTKFKVIRAAGGVVDKEGKTLLIHRNGLWDLPKGKLEKNEDIRSCALREVEEETGVKVVVQEKICHTWHTYTRNKKYILKKTYWYQMVCLDDMQIGPQISEGIDDVKWMTLSQVRASLYDSYRTIRVVMQEYHKLLKKQSL